MADEPKKLDPATEKSDPRVGTVLAERYRLHRLLGIGGMGRVYAAEHVLMHKRLAVKVLHRDLTRVPEVVSRFERWRRPTSITRISRRPRISASSRTAPYSWSWNT